MMDEDFRGDDDYMCGLRIPCAMLLDSNEAHWYRLQDEETVKDPTLASLVRVDKPQQRQLSCPLGAILIETDCKVRFNPILIQF